MITRTTGWLRHRDDPAGLWRIGPAIGITLVGALGISGGCHRVRVGQTQVRL
jgi:hypothetical protein